MSVECWLLLYLPCLSFWHLTWTNTCHLVMFRCLFVFIIAIEMYKYCKYILQLLSTVFCEQESITIKHKILKIFYYTVRYVDEKPCNLGKWLSSMIRDPCDLNLVNLREVLSHSYWNITDYSLIVENLFTNSSNDKLHK